MHEDFDRALIEQIAKEHNLPITVAGAILDHHFSCESNDCGVPKFINEHVDKYFQSEFGFSGEDALQAVLGVVNNLDHQIKGLGEDLTAEKLESALQNAANALAVELSMKLESGNETD